MILALDLGSTSFKAALFTPEFTRAGEGEARLAHDYPGPGKVELAVEEVERAFRQCVAGALGACASHEISAIAITSQAQTFAIVDRNSGCPRTPFFSWQDVRAQQTCAEIQGTPFARAVAEQTGFNALLPNLQLAILLHLSRVEGLALTPADRLMPLPGYLLHLLQHDAFITDNNLAAMSGLYSLPTGAWWPEALQMCGLTPAMLPELRAVGSTGARTGDAARSYGINPGIPIILAGNDQTAGAYGASVHSNGSLLVTLGTALVAYCVSDTLPEPLPEGIALRGPYPGGRFYQLTTESAGGNVLIWVAQALGFGEDLAACVNEALTAAEDSRGLSFLPDLPAGAGSWQGIGLYHTRADLARAVLEALSAHVVALINRLRRTPAPLLVAGGGSRIPAWVEHLAHRLHEPLRLVQADPLLGAAQMAAESLTSHQEEFHV